MDGSFLAILVTSLFLCSQANGFCGSRSLHTSLVRSAVRAGEWLRNNHDGNGTYHEGHVSAFVFHSLRMIGHSVDKGADHMNAEITTRGLGSIPGGRIGLYIHGVLAACRDPKRFYNFNLVRALTTKLKKFPQPGFDDYFKYSLAVMALCSSGRTALPYVDKIIERMSSRLRDEYVDTLAYQVMALSCVRNRGEGMVVEKVQNWIEVGSQELLRRKGNESHIHDNEVSTALASQALLAANVKKWKSCKTLRWLQARQNPDGSFSSLMSTVYLIPSLIGALPYEVGDIPCHRTDLQQQKELIDVCLEVEFEDNKYTIGKIPPPRVCVTVLNGTNTHDIMKQAANNPSWCKFTTQKTGYGHMLLSMCGVVRSYENKLYWSMYIDGRSPRVGIDNLRPQNGTTILFKYRKINWDY